MQTTDIALLEGWGAFTDRERDDTDLGSRASDAIREEAASAGDHAAWVRLIRGRADVHGSSHRHLAAWLDRDHHHPTLWFRLGDGHIRLAWEDAAWLVRQPGTPALAWVDHGE